MIESALNLNERSFIEALEHASTALDRFKLRIIDVAQSFDILHTAVEVFDKVRESLDFSAHMQALSVQTTATARDMAVLGQAFKDSGLDADSASRFAGKLQWLPYSAATCAPFSATERRMRRTEKTRVKERTPKAKKVSK